MRKEFKNWPEYQQANTRRDRRRKVIQVNNRQVNAHKFLLSRSKSLPKLIDKETGNPINHEANLKAVYDGKGIEGVNQYVQAVKAICERDKGGIWQKIKGWYAEQILRVIIARCHPKRAVTVAIIKSIYRKIRRFIPA